MSRTLLESSSRNLASQLPPNHQASTPPLLSRSNDEPEDTESNSNSDSRTESNSERDRGGSSQSSLDIPVDSCWNCGGDVSVSSASPFPSMQSHRVLGACLYVHVINLPFCLQYADTTNSGFECLDCGIPN